MWFPASPNYVKPCQTTSNYVKLCIDVERNKQTLRDALNHLPRHRPPEGLEGAIFGEVNRTRHEAPLRRALAELPTYEAPAATEAALFERLQRETQQPRRTARVVRLRRFARYGVAAAVAVLLLVLFNPPGGGETDLPIGTIAYSTEVMDEHISLAGFDEDQEIFAEILAVCEVRKFTCEQDRFVGLRDQLEELNDARNMLREAIGSYGTDPDLVAQLTKLERERSGVLKELLQVI